MKILSVEELLEWIDGTGSPNESPERTHARFKTSFGLGTPREIFVQMEKNFHLAMAAHSRRQPKE